METQIQLLAKEFNQNETNVKNVVDLIDEGYTIPFIARYR
ncbi:MAG: Tex-like N-terminal domain-containing protein, partial [Clostridiaceae bacterium]